MKLKQEGPSRADITNLRDFLKRPIARKDLQERLDLTLAPLCKVLDIKPIRVQSADGDIRQTYQKPLY